MLYSGLSRGTERLVFDGRVPQGEHGRMRMPTQEGNFPFPVKYGYSAVGTVENGPSALKGRTVFALHPHQTRFVIGDAAVVPVPDTVPPKRAVLTANLETALNVLWDGEAKAGQKIAVVGGGLVGLLVAGLAAKPTGAKVTLIEGRHSHGKLRFRSTPFALHRLPAAEPSGLATGTSHTSTSGPISACRRPRTAGGVTGSLPCSPPITSTRLRAESTSRTNASMSRPCTDRPTTSVTQLAGNSGDGMSDGGRTSQIDGA
jgi:hypothetical protein